MGSRTRRVLGSRARSANHGLTEVRITHVGGPIALIAVDGRRQGPPSVSALVDIDGFMPDEGEIAGAS